MAILSTHHPDEPASNVSRVLGYVKASLRKCAAFLPATCILGVGAAMSGDTVTFCSFNSSLSPFAQFCRLLVPYI